MNERLEDVYVSENGEFIHPVWGAKCPDYLKIIPRDPLSEMDRQEKIDWICRHQNRLSWKKPCGVAHNIKVTRYFSSAETTNWLNMMSAENSFDLWEITGLNAEIENMQYEFDRSLDVQQDGRSGGWLILLEDRRPVHVPDREILMDEDEFDDMDIDRLARNLMWFDVLVNGMIATAKASAAYLKVERRPVVTWADFIVDPEEESAQKA